MLGLLYKLFIVQYQQNQQGNGKRRKERKQKPRRFLVNLWLSQRERLDHSHYYQLMETLRSNDTDHYKNFTRLEPALFDELLQRIHHRISRQRAWYRDPLDPGLKLAVILRHLATGNSYTDLAYAFRVPNNSISKFVPEVCQAILDEYLEEVVPAPCTVAE